MMGMVYNYREPTSYNDPVAHAPNIKVYASNAALTVAAASTQDGKTYTVNLEGARIINRDTGYDWDNKLVLQVSPSEGPEVLAVLAGWSTSIEYSFHGPGRNKGYRMTHSDSHLLVTVFSKDSGQIAIPIKRAERLAITALFFRQFQRNYGGIGTDTLFTMCRDIYSTSTSDVVQRQIL